MTRFLACVRDVLVIVVLGAMVAYGLRQYVDSRAASATHSIRYASDACMFNRVYCPRDGRITDCFKRGPLECVHCGWSR